jgi:hypothetical protein
MIGILLPHCQILILIHAPIHIPPWGWGMGIPHLIIANYSLAARYRFKETR